MPYDSKELIKLLKRQGWVLDRVRGSHHVFKKGNVSVSVPHPRKDMSKGLYLELLKIIANNKD